VVSELINVDLPEQEVVDLLLELHPTSDRPGPAGVDLWFGDHRFANVYDADPDDGTDIVTKDRSGSADYLCWQLYDHLCGRTEASVWLMDDDGRIAAARWGPGQTEGRVVEDSLLARTGYPPGH
jgi:hypothetical protein